MKIPKNQTAISGRLLTLFLLLAAAPTSAQQIDLSSDVDQGEFQAARFQVEYSGNIVVDLSRDKNLNPSILPIDVTGQFAFDQQLSGKPNSMQAVRYYTKASANIKAGKGHKASHLEPDNRYILGRIRTLENQNQFQIASIGSVLQRSEYELLRNPCDPVALIGLVDQQNVSVGDTWQVEKGALGRFLNIDHVISADVEFKLKKANSTNALIHVSGHLKGEIDDVVTELDVAGSLQMDRKLNRITAVRININQETDPGQVAPGFQGQIKLDMRIKTIAASEHLTRDKLADVMTGNKIKQSFLLKPQGAPFSVIHSPNWRVIASEEEAAVLRYIRDGNLLAQCNMVQLPNRPADNPLPLNAFEAEVKKMIQSSDSLTIKSSNTAETANGYPALRVVVEGFESGVPIRWLYYHISNQDGIALTCVFTLEKQIAEQFGKADQTFVNRVQLLTRAAQRQTEKENDETIR